MNDDFRSGMGCFLLLVGIGILVVLINVAHWIARQP